MCTILAELFKGQIFVNNTTVNIPILNVLSDYGSLGTGFCEIMIRMPL